MRAAFALAGLVLLASSGAQAETCPPGKPQPGKPVAARKCPAPPAAKYEPYDPDRMRAGSKPGFIDLGNGTEVRVGGRTQMEYGVRR